MYVLATIRCGLALTATVAGTIANGADHQLRLQLPVNCAMATVCDVQNYFDHDSGPGFRDYNCGNRGYDGHDGTDIRLPNLAVMRDGVAVLAAAAGRVRAVRDEMPDVSVAEVDRQTLKGREAGNAVAIEHGDGWETQYSHMRRSSVRVRPGEPVYAGQILGYVGMSGNAEFPHLHFEVRHKGVSIDPFTGLESSQRCGTNKGETLWGKRALANLDYPPAGLLQAGFADEAPSSKAVLEDTFGFSTLPVSAPALVFWIEAFGVRAGDTETLKITGPHGDLLVEKTGTVPDDKARWLRFVGKRQKKGAWPPGEYRGDYRLVRAVKGNGQPVLEIERRLLVR